MKKIILLLCFFFGLAILWIGRYTIFATPSECAYKLGRFTGNVTFMWGFKETPVVQYKKSDKAKYIEE